MIKLLKSQSIPQNVDGRTDSTLDWTEFLFDPDDPDVVPTTLLPRHLLRQRFEALAKRHPAMPEVTPEVTLPPGPPHAAEGLNALIEAMNGPRVISLNGIMLVDDTASPWAPELDEGAVPKSAETVTTTSERTTPSGTPDDARPSQQPSGHCFFAAIKSPALPWAPMLFALLMTLGCAVILHSLI